MDDLEHDGGENRIPGSLDFMLSDRRISLFHASQTSVFDRVYDTGTHEQHRAMFANTAFTGFGASPDIVGYGDIHRAHVLNFDGRTLFNAGSVGNPLDVPLACYAVSYAVIEGTMAQQQTVTLVPAIRPPAL